jgi:anti-sigma regulatory factor (Ser/Thr protein kinase)
VGHSGETEAVKGELLFNSVLSREGLGPMRRLLTGWATGEGLDTDTVQAIVLSGYEALANSVEHGYREHGHGPIELYACRTDDGVTITVVDHGRWRTPSADPGLRGRGLDLVRGLSSHAEVTRSDHGTTVTMIWRNSGHR